MSLRKALSPIIFIAASFLGLSSVASASIINVLVETNDFDAISIDGFFELDTTNPESWEVTDWSLDVTVNSDPNLNPFNSFSVASAGTSMISFIANSPLAACDVNGDCLNSVDLTFAPIGNVSAGTQLGVTSVCATTSTLALATAIWTVCNSSTASITVMVTAVTGGGVGAVPEPTALALFGIGMLVIYPIQRRLYR